MNNIGFTSNGFNDYTYWQTEDGRTLKKINKLILDIRRNGYDGIGSPEPLKGNMVGYWSREVDQKNRLVYTIKDNGDVEIIGCRGHYDDK